MPDYSIEVLHILTLVMNLYKGEIRIRSNHTLLSRIKTLYVLWT